MSDFAKQVSDIAEEFVIMAGKRVNEKLDFSIESIKAVEEYLDEAHEFSYIMTDEWIMGISSSVGSYIFEVARRNFGGNYYWFDKLNQPILVTGQPEFEVSLLAIEKVKGRIVNGIEDNISFFFDGYVSAVKRGEKEKGYHSMIV